MKLLVTIGLTIFMVIGAAVAIYWHSYPSYTHRYRLIVEIEVDGQIKSGSSVIEAVWNAQPADLAGGKPFSTKVYGEAVFIDLGPRGPLIVTLWGDDALVRSQSSQSAIRLALRAFGLRPDRTGLSAIPPRGSRAEVPVDALPMMVTFTDLNDPKTVRAFTPSEVQEIFGPSVRIHAAMVEITDAAISQSIRNRLPWLKAMKRGDIVGKLQGGRYPNLHATYLIGEAS